MFVEYKHEQRMYLEGVRRRFVLRWVLGLLVLGVGIWETSFRAYNASSADSS